MQEFRAAANRFAASQHGQEMRAALEMVAALGHVLAAQSDAINEIKVSIHAVGERASARAATEVTTQLAPILERIEQVAADAVQRSAVLADELALLRSLLGERTVGE